MSLEPSMSPLEKERVKKTKEMEKIGIGFQLYYVTSRNLFPKSFALQMKIVDSVKNGYVQSKTVLALPYLLTCTISKKIIVLLIFIFV